MSSIMRRRNGLTASSVMGMLLFWVKVANPSSQNRTPRRAIVLAVPPAPAPYRASGLVLWHIASLCRYAAIRRLSRHSGLWRGVSPADLWVHGLAARLSGLVDGRHRPAGFESGQRIAVTAPARQLP